MSIYMLDKFRKELEIFASKVDPSAAGNDQDFPQSFDIEGRYQKSGR
jgi:hypothetical protein